MMYRTGAQQFSLAYTWSKTMSTIIGNQNDYNFHANYGPTGIENDITEHGSTRFLTSATAEGCLRSRWATGASQA